MNCNKLIKKKKILLLGGDYYGYKKSIARAFERNGCLVESVDISYVFRPAFSYLGLQDRAIAYFLKKGKELQKKLQLDYNNRIKNTVQEYKPDLIFVISDGEILDNTAVELNSCPVFVWMTDTVQKIQVDRKLEIFKRADKIFTFERSDIDYIESYFGQKGKFLPMAMDDEIFFPQFRMGKEIDLSFIGYLYPERKEMLEQLSSRFKDKVVKIYNYHYNKYKRPFYHLLRKNKNVFINRAIWPNEANIIYNNSKICLNIHHKQNSYGVNPRFFEICGSGGFQLVDSNLFIIENFSSDEIMIYKDLNDLVNKIDLVFSGEIDVVGMSQKAYKKVLNNHTFLHRIREVLLLI